MHVLGAIAYEQVLTLGTPVLDGSLPQHAEPEHSCEYQGACRSGPSQGRTYRAEHALTAEISSAGPHDSSATPPPSDTEPDG